MPVPLIPCRNTLTGAETEIPETALRHMPDWQPITDDEDAATAPSSASEATPPATDRPAASAAGKSKAAKATTKED